MDCGVGELVLLDFDHRGGKRFNVTVGVHREYSLARLEAEIARCEVRCANCHRRRTAAEHGHFRHRATLRGP